MQSPPQFAKHDRVLLGATPAVVLMAFSNGLFGVLFYHMGERKFKKKIVEPSDLSFPDEMVSKALRQVWINVETEISRAHTAKSKKGTRQ